MLSYHIFDEKCWKCVELSNSHWNCVTNWHKYAIKKLPWLSVGENRWNVKGYLSNNDPILCVKSYPVSYVLPIFISQGVGGLGLSTDDFTKSLLYMLEPVVKLLLLHTNNLEDLLSPTYANQIFLYAIMIVFQCSRFYRMMSW